MCYLVCISYYTDWYYLIRTAWSSMYLLIETLKHFFFMQISLHLPNTINLNVNVIHTNQPVCYKHAMPRINSLGSPLNLLSLHSPLWCLMWALMEAHDMYYVHDFIHCVWMTKFIGVPIKWNLWEFESTQIMNTNVYNVQRVISIFKT